MNDRSFDQLLDAWLDLGPASAPNRVLEAVRLEIRSTRQAAGPLWLPPRRFLDMNPFAKLVLAAAGAVVVVIIGVALLPGSGPRVGGPDASASPLATSPPQPNPTAEPSATPEAEFPPAGPLAVGTHRVTLSDVLVIFELATDGWVSNGEVGIDKGRYVLPGRPEVPGSAGFIFWRNSWPDTVFADPCAGTPLNPAPDPSPEALAAAVASLPGIELVSGPNAVTVGGYAAQHVAIRIPDSIGCGPDEFDLWEDTDTPGLARYATEVGSTIHSWIIDVDGKLLWIDAETYATSGPEAEREVLEIVDSIRLRQHRGPG